MRSILIGVGVFCVLYAAYLVLLNASAGAYLIWVYAAVPVIAGAVTRKYASHLPIIPLIIVGLAAMACIGVINLAVARFGYATHLAELEDWVGRPTYVLLLAPVLVVAGGVIASVAPRG